MLRIVGLLLPLVLLIPCSASVPSSGFSLDRRIPFTTSRVQGWPDPPLPYRTKRVFEQQKLRAPVYLISNPHLNRIFVVEQNGRIVHFDPTSHQPAEVFLQLKDADTYSMTFHPQYATNRLVYIFSNGPNSATKKKNQILRFQVSGTTPRCDPASRQLVIEWESNGHNGGDLAFGPDGMLYITSGDGSSDSDTDNTGQDLRDLCSGMLRIDVSRSTPDKPYSVPPDNPFLKLKGARPELWAFGFRNPWRMTFDPRSGDLLVGDVGQDLWEMIRLVKRGSNHGWSLTEGSRDFHPQRILGPGPIVAPLIEHPHSESRSITGGIVYTGKRFPELRGAYIYGDYATGKIWALRQTDSKVTWKQDLALTRLQIVGFGADRDGELYIVDHGGQIHQLEKSPPAAPSKFPRSLADTGLFRSVKDHLFQPGVIPYSVNSPLWSDGSHKERAIALPDLETIGFSEQGFWTFPAGTVLLKTFSLDMADGNRHRIETRIMTLQQGEWYGYTYLWKADQSDAILVDAAGENRTFKVRDKSSPGGARELSWRFPSRIECMVCHTRAANYVLGLSTAQLNCDHNYDGTRRNQLRVLEQLGVLRVPQLRHWEMKVQQGRDVAALIEKLADSPALAPLARFVIMPTARSITMRLSKYAATARGKAEKAPPTSRLPQSIAELPRLVDPANPSFDLQSRVRSYLHSNCAHCHVWAGGGNSAIDLHMNTPLEKMKLLNETPLHDRFGIADARLVAPGAPERSILYQRLSRRGRGQMPPLASHVVDKNAQELVRAWIKELEAKGRGVSSRTSPQ